MGTQKHKTTTLAMVQKYVVFKHWGFAREHGGRAIYHYLDEKTGACMCGKGTVGEDGKLYNQANFGKPTPGHITSNVPGYGVPCSSCHKIYERSVEHALS